MKLDKIKLNKILKKSDIIKIDKINIKVCCILSNVNAISM